MGKTRNGLSMQITDGHYFFLEADSDFRVQKELLNVQEKLTSFAIFFPAVFVLHCVVTNQLLKRQKHDFDTDWCEVYAKMLFLSRE